MRITRAFLRVLLSRFAPLLRFLREVVFCCNLLARVCGFRPSVSLFLASFSGRSFVQVARVFFCFSNYAFPVRSSAGSSGRLKALLLKAQLTLRSEAQTLPRVYFADPSFFLAMPESGASGVVQKPHFDKPKGEHLRRLPEGRAAVKSAFVSREQKAGRGRYADG